jgi:hypothetical protein
LYDSIRVVVVSNHNSIMDATEISVTANSQATTVEVDYVEDRTYGVALPNFLQDSVPTIVVLFSGNDKFIFPPESLDSNVSRRNWTPPRSKRVWSKPKHEVKVSLLIVLSSSDIIFML